MFFFFFFFYDACNSEIYPYSHPLALHDALPIFLGFAVASLRVALPLTTDTFSESLFAQGLQSGESMLSYVNEAAGGCLSGDRRLAMLVLLLYAQLFGIIAIARGLYMFWIVSKRTGSQHITVGSSITRSEEHTLNSSH